MDIHDHNTDKDDEEDGHFQATPFNVVTPNSQSNDHDAGTYPGSLYQVGPIPAAARMQINRLRFSEDICMEEPAESECNQSALKRVKICVDEVNIGEDDEEMEELEEVMSVEGAEEGEDPLTLDADHVNLDSSSPQVIEELMFTGNPAIKYPIRYIDGFRKQERKTFKCYDCPAVQYSLEGYLSHKQGHVKQFPYKCPECSFSSRMSQVIGSHRKCHFPEPFGIKGKRKGGGTRQPLARQTARRTKGTRLRLPGKKKKCVYPCLDPKCPWKARDRKRLRWHMEEYHNVKRVYQCDMCTYSSDVSHLFRWHSVTHPSSDGLARGGVVNNMETFRSIQAASNSRRRRAFKCRNSNCPQVFTSSINRSKHMRRHGSNDQFGCTYCDYASPQKGFLDLHLSWHEGGHTQLQQKQNKVLITKAPDTANPEIGKPLPTLRCEDPECHHKYFRAYDLEQHMKCHGGAFKYMCGSCSFGSNTYWTTWKHRSLHKTRTNQWQRTKSVVSFHFQQAKQKKTSRFATPLRYSAMVECLQTEFALLSEAETAEIRAGNPRFTYQTSSTTPSGKRVYLYFKCLICPAAFRSIDRWVRHQVHQHGCQRFVDWYKCQMCSYATFCKGNLVLHYKRGNHHGKSADSPGKNLARPQNTQEDYLVNNPDDEAKTIDEPETQTVPKAATSLNNLEKAEPQISESDDILKERVQQLISKVKIVNFKAIDERIIKLNSNLYEVPGGRGKTTTIVACLVGLGYDVLFDLTSLGDLDLNDVVRHGEMEGLIEMKLNLNGHKELRRKYGSELKIIRKFQKGISLKDSPIEIAYENVKSKSLSRTQFKDLISSLIPEYAWRVMVLGTENLQYLSDNFVACDNIFWEIVKEEEDKISLSIRQLKYQNEAFSTDLASREQRISFLNASLKRSYPENAKLRQLQVAHAIELKSANEQYKFVKDTLQKIRLLQSSSEQTDPASDILEEMRVPFCKFLQAQNYTGDILLGSKDDGSQELIAWMKDSPTQPAPSTPDDARNIWKGMSGGKKKLVVLGLYVSFWRVIESCPVMLSDAHSSCQFEFSFPRSALPVLIDVIHEREDSQGQFFMSLP